MSDVEDWEKAKRIFLTQVKTSINIENTNELYWQLGIWGNFSQQIRLLNQILNKLDNETDLICLNMLGITNRKLGNYQKAIEIFERTLSIIRQIRDQKKEAAVLCNLGNLYRDLGEFQKAIEFHSQSLSIFSDKNPHLHI